MSAQPHDASSVEDVEKKMMAQTNDSVSVRVAGEVVSGSTEYDRYLDLHRQFEGAGMRKLLRKRLWHENLKITSSGG